MTKNTLMDLDPLFVDIKSFELADLSFSRSHINQGKFCWYPPTLSFIKYKDIYNKPLDLPTKKTNK